MTRRTAAKHPIVDLELTTRGTTPVVSSGAPEVEVYDVSSDQPVPPGSPVFESQREYLEYEQQKKAQRDAVNGTALDDPVNDGNIEEAATVDGRQHSEVVLESVNTDKLNINIAINMEAGYSGAPVINFHVYTIEPKGKKRAGDENEGGERKKQVRRS